MKAFVVRYHFFFAFIAWAILFFPSWYVLSYTKVRELQQLVGRSREDQLLVLHPTSEMKSLIELRRLLSTQFSGKTVAILATVRQDTAPLATDVSIQRAVLEDIPIKSAEELDNSTEVLVIIYPSSQQERAWNDEQDHICREKTPVCFAGKVICWPV